MHVRTSKLAIKKIPGLYPRAQIQQGMEREWRKGRGREKERRGKGKGRRHDGRKWRKEGMGNSDGGGIAPLLLGGIDATARGPLKAKFWLAIAKSRLQLELNL